MRKRIAKISKRVASVSATEFEVGDLVGVSGQVAGMHIFDNSATGIVANVDYKANRVFVDVHQDEKSDKHPTQYRPEELFLMWRSEDEIKLPIFAVPKTRELSSQAHNFQPRDEKWQPFGQRPI